MRSPSSRAERCPAVSSVTSALDTRSIAVQALDLGVLPVTFAQQLLGTALGDALGLLDATPLESRAVVELRCRDAATTAVSAACVASSRAASLGSPGAPPDPRFHGRGRRARRAGRGSITGRQRDDALIGDDLARQVTTRQPAGSARRHGARRPRSGTHSTRASSRVTSACGSRRTCVRPRAASELARGGERRLRSPRPRPRAPSRGQRAVPRCRAGRRARARRPRARDTPTRHRAERGRHGRAVPGLDLEPFAEQRRATRAQRRGPGASSAPLRSALERGAARPARPQSRRPSGPGAAARPCAPQLPARAPCALRAQRSRPPVAASSAASMRLRASSRSRFCARQRASARSACRAVGASSSAAAVDARRRVCCSSSARRARSSRRYVRIRLRPARAARAGARPALSSSSIADGVLGAARGQRQDCGALRRRAARSALPLRGQSFVGHALGGLQLGVDTRGVDAQLSQPARCASSASRCATLALRALGRSPRTAVPTASSAASQRRPGPRRRRRGRDRR